MPPLAYPSVVALVVTVWLASTSHAQPFVEVGRARGDVNLRSVSAFDPELDGQDTILAFHTYQALIYAWGPDSVAIESGGSFWPIQRRHAMADLDGDGRGDLVLWPQSGELSVHLGQPDGSWIAAGTSQVTIYSQPRFGDFNGDGALDFLSKEDLGWSIHYGDGAGGITRTLFSAFEIFDVFSVADVNGDGVDDILRSHGSSGLAVVYGTPLNTLVDTAPFTLHGLGNDVIARFLDLDGDGTPEIVAGGDEELRVLERQPDEEYVATSSQVLAFEYFGLETIDLDGDGDLDLLTYYDTDYQVFLNDAGALVPLPLTDSGSDGFISSVTPFHLDGDGKVDLCLRIGDELRFYRNLSGQLDCDGSGFDDVGEILAGTSSDCDGDGVPDRCQLDDGSGSDCNLNGQLDSCDIGSGESLDVDVDGIPDECSSDCNGNGLADSAEIALGTVFDCNDNGLIDQCEISSGLVLDCDENGVPDACDPDGDGDGSPDICTAGVIRRVPSEYATIQAAIDAADAGDHVLISPGVYPENLDLDGKPLTLRSTDGAETTTIEGNVFTLGSTIRSCLHAVDVPAPGFVVEGLTFALGQGTVYSSNDRAGGGIYCVNADASIRGNRFVSNFTDERGGAIYTGGTGTVSIERNTFLANRSRRGGAVYVGNVATDLSDNLYEGNGSSNSQSGPGGSIFVAGVSGPESLVTIEREVIRDGVSPAEGSAIGVAFRAASIEGCTFDGNGGESVLCIDNAPLVAVSDCTFRDNRSVAIEAAFSIIDVRRNEIVDNHSYEETAGVTIGSSVTGTVEDNRIARNVSQEGSVFCVGCDIDLRRNTIIDNLSLSVNDGGGGVKCAGATVRALSNVVADNRAFGVGGGFHVVQSTVDIVGCSVVGNVALGSTGGGMLAASEFFGNSSSVTVQATIGWQNGGSPIENSGGNTIEVTYSLIEGGATGVGNLDEDPLFVDLAGRDLHLSPLSPCIDAAVVTGLASHWQDIDGDGRQLCAAVDMGADELPDVGCAGPTIADVRCEVFDETWPVLEWEAIGPVDEVRISRGGSLLATIPGYVSEYTDTEAGPGLSTYELEPWVGGQPCCAQACSASLPGTFYVDDDAVGPGTGTLIDPFASIQYAITQSYVMDGSTLLVEPGTYIEVIDTLGKQLVLMSTGGPNVTFLRSPGDERILTISNGEGSENIVEGFTFADAFLPTVNGAAILIGSGAQPTIRGNRFVGNYGAFGGAVMSNSWARIEDNEFFDNTAVDGGAVFAGSTTRVIRNLFVGNHAVDEGGAVYTSSGPRVFDNVFYANSAAERGGGLGAPGSSVRVSNNLFYANFAPEGAHAWWTNSQTRFYNNIFWGSGPDSLSGHNSSPVRHCIVEGGYAPGIDVFDVDPQIANPFALDFHLLPTSPAIDAGLNGVEELPLVDFDGEPRPVCGVIDIGPDEVQVDPADCTVPFFRRGDCNDSGTFDLSDPVRLLGYLFAGELDVTCASACDSDDSGQLDIADVVHLLAYVFAQGAAPAAPFDECGGDPTPDVLECDDLTSCP